MLDGSKKKGMVLCQYQYLWVHNKKLSEVGVSWNIYKSSLVLDPCSSFNSWLHCFFAAAGIYPDFPEFLTWARDKWKSSGISGIFKILWDFLFIGIFWMQGWSGSKKNWPFFIDFLLLFNNKKTTFFLNSYFVEYFFLKYFFLKYIFFLIYFSDFFSWFFEYFLFTVIEVSECPFHCLPEQGTNTE